MKFKEIFTKNRLIGASLSLLILIIVLIVILIVNNNKETAIEKFNNAILATIESIKKLEIKNEYLLINFPDKENLISKNGKLQRNNKKKYNEFNKGYVIIYKDGSYSFKVSNNHYCASKGYDDTTIDVDMSAECENYDVEYIK